MVDKKPNADSISSLFENVYVPPRLLTAFTPLAAVNDAAHGERVPKGPNGAAVLATGNFSVIALLATAFAHAPSVYWVSTSVPTGLVASCVSVALAHPVLGKYVEKPSLSVNKVDPNLIIAQGEKENQREMLFPRSNASLESLTFA